MKKMKSTTQLTIFSTLLLTATIFILYVMLITDINSDMQSKGFHYTYAYIRSEAVILFLVTSILAFLASSIIIDKVLNPIRLMIFKVNEIGNMDFSKPLVINSEDEELREYVIAFNNMSRKLSSYINRQKRFISDASHELVTPITVINGHADLLMRRGREQPDLMDSELKIIKAEALRMDELINSLLLLARSDSGRQNYTFEHIMISGLIKESILEAKVIAPDFDFELKMDRDINVKCDEYAIHRVLRIILSNAIKYSGDSKCIQIKAYESHGLLYVSVKDNGIGIASEHLPRIFDRFYRVDDSRSKKTGSSGLGLAIAKEIINAHGGSIQVFSETDSGTEFSFILST